MELRTERLAASLIARHDFAAAVRLLNEAGIIPMPLKGVLLQHIVYKDPAERILSDADLLVPPGRFGEAIVALRSAGYRIDPAGQAGRSTKGPDARLEVDVHRQLFSPGLYSLRATEVFARGRIDERLFDSVVVIPDPLDFYAHLVGNFAKGRHGAGDANQLRDFGAVASRFSLAPQPVARHLEKHGLARAARYTLNHALADGDAFAGKVLCALRGDPIGRASAALARRVTAKFGGKSLVAIVTPHLVNRSLPRGAVSVGAHVAIGLRTRLARKLRWGPANR